MTLRILPILACLAAIPAAADVWTFESPSENIQCVVTINGGRSELACTIYQRRGRPAAPKPANCTADWGHSFELSETGKPRMVCEPIRRGLDSGLQADHGTTGKFGGFACKSTRKGLDCRNRDGHGFFLSDTRQRLF